MEDDLPPLLPFEIPNKPFEQTSTESVQQSAAAEPMVQPAKNLVKTVPPLTNTSGTGGIVKGSTASAPTGAKKDNTAPLTLRSLQTVSLKKKQEEVVEQKAQEEEKILLNQPFTSDALLRSWNIFIDTIKGDTHLTNALKSCPPVLKENYEIEVTVQNQPLEKKVQDLIIPIERHLHHHLKNTRIKMTVRLAEQGELARPFTSTDKLEAMMQKNPNMELLYRTFGLDIN